MSILTRTWLNSFQRFLPLKQSVVLERIISGDVYTADEVTIFVARKRPNTDEEIIAANVGFDAENCNWSLWNNGETDVTGRAFRPRIGDRIKETVSNGIAFSYDGSGVIAIGDGGILMVQAVSYRFWKIVRVKETIDTNLYACTCVKELDV